MDEEFLSQIDHVAEFLPDPHDKKLDDEVLICECFCVSVRDIRTACAHLHEVDLRLLQENLSLGHGCQTCLRHLDSWVTKIF